ncbi:tetratricopeptide repeat protein [Luteolibacter sp. Populi]|uniref:tetratricopeptide repeat protein n=1 Tax=Luteolibacter sp. Populi TaxID=3230487 RepID=UPI003466B6AB
MKPTFRTLLICLLPFSALHAQVPAPAREKRSYEVAFSNLPEAKRKEYGEKLNETRRLFNDKRIFEAVNKANETSAIFPDDPELLSLIGACQVEFRNFDKAMEAFKKADSLAPNDPQTLFNVAELNFVTKNWPEAEINLAKVIAFSPPGHDQPAFQLNRLTEFKLLLVKLKLNKAAEAASIAQKYDYLDDSPFPYYAKAAVLFSEGKDIEAEGQMARAARIFQDPNIVAPWQDTMIEFGYVKGFFGGDEAPAP